MDKRLAKIIDLLEKEYPGAGIALEYSNPLELLIATILSAQCTDVRVNIVTKDLFRKYRTVSDYATADKTEFEQDIHSTGFYRAKAAHIIDAAKMIIRDFSGKVPDNMNDLVKLPGVARKTANVVLCNAFKKNEGIAVDTHVRRLSMRLGLTENDDPEKIEADLTDKINNKMWGRITYLLIEHGRKVCGARKPLCWECVLAPLCPSKV